MTTDQQALPDGHIVGAAFPEDQGAINEANRQVVRDCFMAAQRNDMVEATKSFTDETIVTESRGLPYGGEFRGGAGFIALLTNVFKAWADVQMQFFHVLSTGDHVICIGRLDLTAKNGRKIEVPLTERWHIVDGKTRRVDIMYGDTAMARWALDAGPWQPE